MTPAEYLRTQNTLGLLAHLIAPLDLTGFLSAISTAEAVGPMLNPTLYRDAREKLGQVERLARSALAFRAEAGRQMEAAEAIAEYEQAMTEEGVPEIVEAVKRRGGLAAEARQRIMRSNT